ncbi:MAG: site-2 protease family protein [Anaerolineae bacterium]|nr:site-2 protease family protein [Anaerolineae bacterium]
MLSQTDYSPYDALVARVMRVEDRTLGSEKDRYQIRYRGQLYSEDTVSAYDQLAEALRPYHITPLFRWDEGRHAIMLVTAQVTPSTGNPRLNIILFIATLISILVTGINFNQPDLPTGILPAAWALIQSSLPFTISFFAILSAHEFGHYLVGRYHGTRVSLPYFIPLPFISLFGTFGAMINMKEQPKNRRILLDIGLAGPLAGLAVTVMALVIGLSLSTINTLPAEGSAMTGSILEGNSLLYLLLKYLRFGQLLPAPETYGSLPPLLYWLRYYFTGSPFPYGGLDVTIHPIAWAGWGGMLITSLNLIPAGQLDGGHVFYVLLGRKNAARLLPFILAGLVGLGFFWNGWWLWAGLLFFLGRFYAEPLDEITPLDTPRKILAVIAVLIFILVFIPVPLVLF